MDNNSLAKRIKQLESVLEISRNMSNTPEQTHLLHLISKSAAELTDSRQASILLHDDGTGELTYAAVSLQGGENLTNTRIPLEDSLSGEVIKRRKSITIQDLSKQNSAFTDIISGGQAQPANALAVPLEIAGEIRGVLLAADKPEGDGYTRGDADILEILASQAALALHNHSLVKELQQTQDELTRLDQMKREFIAITSHELRTPVGLILGHATFMREMVPDELKDQVDVIIESSTHMKEIIDDLYKANVFQSGMERLRQRSFSLNELVAEIVHASERLAGEKQVRLNLELPQAEIAYIGDNEKIGIAISHLLRNAVIFNDPGGQATVTLSQTEREVCIRVADTGIGIPDEDQQRIFERFYQVEDHLTREHGGLGLGLSVAKMMVEMHRGRLEVESRTGEGSTFSIYLPRKIEE